MRDSKGKGDSEMTREGAVSETVRR